MSAKHTPGPWAVYTPEFPGSTYGIDGDDNSAVVFFGSNCEEGIRRIEDARLIAAAPELLEALVYLLAWHNAEHSDGDGARTFAETAIAKATGETV